MAKKKEALRKIDQRTKVTGAPITIKQEVGTTPSALRDIPAPENLHVVSQTIAHSAQAAQVWITLAWDEPAFSQPDAYLVEYGLSSAFTGTAFSESTRVRVQSKSAAIVVNQQKEYVIRVQAISGNVLGTFTSGLTVTAIQDTLPAPDITNLSATFTYGNLIITWDQPVADNYKDTQIDIYDASGIVQFGSYTSASGTFIWTADENIRTTSNYPRTSVKIKAYSRSYANTLGNELTYIATATAPITPTNIQSTWIADTGKASKDAYLSWDSVVDASFYDITIDGKTYTVSSLHFLYTYDLNVQDHRLSTISGSPSLSVDIVARSALQQTSTAYHTTLQNNPPNSNMFTVNAYAGFSILYGSVTVLSGAIQDLNHWVYTLYTTSGALSSVRTTDFSYGFTITTPGDYRIGIQAVDVFNQSSSEKVTSYVSVDGLTLDQLRAQTQYSDSINTDPSILNILKDDQYTTPITYSGGVSSWKWIQAARPLLDRYKTITLSALWDTDFQYYIEVSDRTNSVWYAAPVTISGASYTFTRYTDQASAEANAYTPSVSGSATYRINFTNIEEARILRMFFKNPTNAVSFYELYPRRLTQSDDIEVEAIKAINIATNAVTANKIFVTELSAITSNMGTITAGTIIGGTIRTTDTSCLIDNSGVTLKASTQVGGLADTATTTNRIKFTYSTTEIGAIWMSAIRLGAPTNINQNNVNIQTTLPTSGANRTASIVLVAETTALAVRSTGTIDITGALNVSGSLYASVSDAYIDTILSSGFTLSATGANATSILELGSRASGDRYSIIDLHGDDTYTDFGLRILRNNGGANTPSDLQHRGTGALRLIAIDSGSISLLVNTSTARFEVNTTGIGFFGVTPVSRRTGGSATADLTYDSTERDMINRMYTALRDYGLLT